MNINASRITFCETCVVERMVVTHFRKPIIFEGIASVGRGVRGTGVEFDSAIRCRVKDDSNQKRQVI
jgi:hypothetical protein